MSTTRRMPLPRNKGFGCGADILEDNSRAFSKLIAASKTTGALNLSNRQLQEVPEDVFKLPEDDSSVKWWEAVDLTKLDLSHNQIMQLPQELCSLSALATLLLSNNQLQQVPPGIQELQCLRLLDVSDNPQLGPALPEEVALLPSLATLNSNNCGLERLPQALGGPQQPKLSAVSVTGNQLACLPEGLSAATSLVALKAAHNQLQELPGHLVRGWKALRELDVSHNKLQDLPGDELGQLPCLGQLDARNNQLAALPTALGNAAQLHELRVGFNQLSSLPTSLGGLASLKTLDVRNNKLEELPEGLCGLQLVLLDLANNSLRRLPPALGHMTSLRSMPLDGNPLKLMRRELWAGPVSALLQHLRDQEQQLSRTSAQAGAGIALQASQGCVAGTGETMEGSVSLRARSLTSVPADVWQARDRITGLDVSDNNLGADAANIASGLPQLTAVKVLSLNSCALSTWPLAGLSPGCLQNLHTLELRGNALGPCPVNALAACPHLKTLDLSGMRCLQLPEGVFSHTPQLEQLIASRAGLSDFPAAVLDCTSLKRLDLSSNSLSSMPLQVTQLTRLEELDLSNNQLTNLPPQVGLMSPHLRVLRLDGNCIRAIRRPVLERGTAAVLEWLTDRIPAA